MSDKKDSASAISGSDSGGSAGALPLSSSARWAVAASWSNRASKYRIVALFNVWPKLVKSTTRFQKSLLAWWLSMRARGSSPSPT